MQLAISNAGSLGHVSLLFDYVFLNLLHLVIELSLVVGLFFDFVFENFDLSFVVIRHGLVGLLLSDFDHALAKHLVLILELFDHLVLSTDHFETLFLKRFLVIFHNAESSFQLSDLVLSLFQHS